MLLVGNYTICGTAMPTTIALRKRGVNSWIR
jgi:hypothetical protein